MAKNIYVGNLSWSTTEEVLRETFEQYGEVLSARIITDRDTGRSRGFGFVEMEDEDEANAAIEGLNGQAMDGRPLTVNEARPRAPRTGGGGGGRGGSRGGGGGGGGYNRRY
jgi:RNA recognition motif-containing protein